MATAVIIQKMGQQMESGIIAKWLVEEGDPVNENDPLFEMETDKVTVEVPAPVSGIITIVNSEIGVEHPVGETVAYIVDKYEKFTMSSHEGATAPTLEQESSIEKNERAIAKKEVEVPVSDRSTLRLEEKRIKASPYARKLCREHNINPKEISASAVNGRITAIDVLDHLNRRGTMETKTKLSEDYSGQGINFTEVPLTSMRKTIATTVQQSASSIVPVTITRTVRADKLLKLREELKNEGVTLSPNDFIIYAVSRALLKYNIFNSVFADGFIKQYREINIGFAVAVDNGLLMPVIRKCNKKSISEIAYERKRLVEMARDNSLPLGYCEQGTFSISSLGQNNVESFSPVIYPSQAAILGVGAIQKSPVVEENDQLGIGYLMKLSLVFDHRVTDGAPACEFLDYIGELLESPLKILV